MEEARASATNIFEQYRELLFSIAYRMLGSRADAEDMATGNIHSLAAGILGTSPQSQIAFGNDHQPSLHQLSAVRPHQARRIFRRMAA